MNREIGKKGNRDSLENIRLGVRLNRIQIHTYNISKIANIHYVLSENLFLKDFDQADVHTNLLIDSRYRLTTRKVLQYVSRLPHTQIAMMEVKSGRTHN